MESPHDVLSGIRYSNRDLFYVRSVATRLSKVMTELTRAVRPGTSGVDLNAYAVHLLKQQGLESAVLGHEGFPAAVAVSPDSLAVHGVPDETPLQEGSVVTLDLGVRRDGWHADTARTVGVGRVSSRRAALIQAAYACCRAGIRVVRDGCDISEIGAAVRAEARSRNVHVIAVCGGHGVGRSLHESPHYRYSEMPRGLLLRQGNIITVEPVVTDAPDELRLAADGFSMVTRKGGLTAQFEHTVYVDESGPVVLTGPDGN